MTTSYIACLRFHEMLHCGLNGVQPPNGGLPHLFRAAASVVKCGVPDGPLADHGHPRPHAASVVSVLTKADVVWNRALSDAPGTGVGDRHLRAMAKP